MTSICCSRRLNERYFRLDRKHGARMLCGRVLEPFGVVLSHERNKFSPVNVIVLCVDDYEATIEDRNNRC
jgi:hypothetical protein